MKKKVTVRGTIKSYLRWPLILMLLPLLMSVHAYVLTSSTLVGRVMTLYTLFYCMVAVILNVHYRNRISPSLVRYAASYGKVQKQLLREMDLPLGVMDTDGHLLWANDEFVDIIRDEKAARKDINNVIPELTKAFFPQGELDEELHFALGERSYRAVLRKIVLEEDAEENAKGLGRDLEKLCDNSCLINLYLYDETEILQYIQENREQKMVSGLIYIDNYEEALESMDEVKRSLLVALVDRKVSKYMQEIDAIVRKMEKDKYFVVFQQKYLAKLQSERFSILEDIRSISRGNDMAVTVSIGIGVNEDSYLGSYEAARAAIDLALGRGGDQAVVKEREKISYYGGKSMQVERNTRVKARVKAHALKELVEAKDEVVVMGHSVGDVDCFGAAVGIYRIAKALGKRAYIVINEITASVRANAERIQNSPDYEEDIIIGSARAKEIVNNDTLLVVVDVNRPSYTECPELLHQTQTVVILDHHRKTGEAIGNAVLSYIEPYASSACEMVAEILQYIDDGIKLKPVEADAMYAGIMIDTNNFLTKTGVRTFEAAAYLKRHGADVTRIRKGLRSDMKEYKIRAEAVKHTEIYKDCYAITVCAAEGADSPTVLGAQVANELLDISGVKASFVLTEFNDKIYISARSIDEVNVQLVMERLGGGGHMSVAGAQLTECNIEEAKAAVRRTLDEMSEEGEL